MRRNAQMRFEVTSKTNREMIVTSLCSLAILLLALAEQGWSQASKRTNELPCETFNKALGYHEDAFAPADSEVHILTTGYFTISGKLYQRIIATRREAEYIGLIQIYPPIELLRFGEHYGQGCVAETRGSSPFRDRTSCLTESAREIDSILGSKSEQLTPEKVVTKELSSLDGRFRGDSRCDAFVPQSRPRHEGSSDAWRVFIRNYRIGHRLSTGTYCDNWDQEDQQLLFYEAFVPTVLSIDGKIVVVDEMFPGVLEGNKFQHVCALSQAVQSYAIDSNALTRSVQRFGNLCNAESGPSLWSCQVSRNILIGSHTLNNTVERPDLTPQKLPPAPSIVPRAN